MSLSHSDLAQLRTTLATLLAPLDYATVDEWRSAVCQNTTELLGADKASFFILDVHSNPIYELNMESGTSDAYLGYYQQLDTRYMRRARGLSTGLDEQYHPDPAEYYRSEYYNDFIVPYRMHHVLTAVVDHGTTQYAGLSFHHDSPKSRPFGARELALLDLLFPAFRAGVDTLQRAHAARENVTKLLDVMGEGMVVCDRSGRVVHANTAYINILAQEPEKNRIRAAVHEIASALRNLQNGDASSRTGAIGTVLRELSTATNGYQLRGSYGEELFPELEGALLVQVDRLTRALPAVETLRERFGLTKREAAVALLLARGKSSGDIAQELSISPHTARRHTESILPKLGIHSRAEVASRIL